MENNKHEHEWGKALQVFSEISTWIVVPIIIGIIAGKALDKNFGSSPWFVIGCTFLAFAVSSYGIVHAVRKFAAKIHNKK